MQESIDSPFPLSTFASFDGMKSFSNRRWADRKVWFNVLADPVSAATRMGGRRSKWFDKTHEVTPPSFD